MGYYINPLSGTKEEFLEREATPFTMSKEVRYADIEPDKALVCLMNNGPFTAAGIVYRQRELEEMTLPTDLRPKKWFTISRDKLWAVSSILPNYFE
jgi:hypothetical protein